MQYKVLPVLLLFTWVSAFWTAPTLAQNKIIIAAFGDSLSAGYQLPPAAAFPNQLQKALADKGIQVEVQNAAVSGDTASGGLSRLDWSIGPEVEGVILELGANDALRGIDPKITRKAIDDMIARFKERGIEVLLAGMVAPPNLGNDFGKAFNSIYPDLAAKYEVDLYPFFLEGVATNPELNLPDRLHPTEEGVAVIVEGILPKVEALLDRIDEAS
ncbi:MAG: arylesterase [Hyphomicrobiales bacterium]